MRRFAVLLLSFVLLSAAAWLRPPEYDESYSIFLTAGHPRPAWPAGVFHPAQVRDLYRGDPSLRQIARDLRRDDVHPPLYFWALKFWRQCFGPGWFAARMLSVGFSVAALALLAWIAESVEIPVLAATLIALLSYGFAYTGIVARGFALAQLLDLLGMALILAGLPRPPGTRGPAWLGLLGGLAFGAASFSNYLACFIAMAAFFWLLLRRQGKRLALGLLGYAVFLPPLLYFFRAQHDARPGQFQPFSAPHATALLTKDFGAALFGGLPVYAGRLGGLVIAALALFSVAGLVCIFRNWRPALAPFALAVLAMPAGLLALGLIFDNTPIEIRYLAFAMPFLALLLAATLPPGLRALLLGIEALGIIGLVLAPATMQKQALSARQIARLDLPDALVLLPFGNDGVGIPGPFIATAPDALRLELIRPGAQPDLSHESDIVVATLSGDDASTQATARILARLDSDPCWRQQAATKLLVRFTRICGLDKQ